MEGLERIVSEHRLFDGLGPEFVNLAAGCAKNVRFNADQYLFHADDPAVARCSSRRWAKETSSV